MTHLINCYENIEIEIEKLRITEEEFGESAEVMYNSARVRSILESSMERTYLNDMIQLGVVQDDLLQFDGLYQSLDPSFPNIDIFYKIRINTLSHQITLFSSLLDNYIPLRAHQRTQILMLSKFFIKTNSSLKYGSFRIDPSNGEMCLCMSSVMTQHQLNSLLIQPMRVTEYIDQEIIKSKYYWKSFIGKILHFINELDEDFHQESRFNKIRVKEVHKGVSYFDDLLSKIYPYLHLEFAFMYSENTYTGNKQMSPEQIIKLSEIIKAVKQTRKNIIPEIVNLLQKVTGYTVNCDPSKQIKLSDEEKKQMVGMLLPPVMRFPKGQPSKVFSEIEILSNLNTDWEVIDQGGFGRISRSVVKFKFSASQTNQMNDENEDYQYFVRHLVCKEDFNPNMSKIPHQKAILSKINPHSSPFIAKFYYSNQQPFASFLFAQFCPQKSLASFRLRTKEFLTLTSKLFILRYIAQAIKFLKDNHVLHLDLKPSNILISPGLVKLIDFGESYHPEVCQKNFRPGISLPYAPPESFLFDLYTNSNFLDRIDIFSFGVLMHELLFDSYPIYYLKHKYQQAKKKYADKNYQIYLVPEKYSKIGYQLLNYWLMGLILKCLETDQKKRPCAEWIIIYLNYCINLEQCLYI